MSSGLSRYYGMVASALQEGMQMCRAEEFNESYQRVLSWAKDTTRTDDQVYDEFKRHLVTFDPTARPETIDALVLEVVDLRSSTAKTIMELIALARGVTALWFKKG